MFGYHVFTLNTKCLCTCYQSRPAVIFYDFQQIIQLSCLTTILTLWRTLSYRHKSKPFAWWKRVHMLELRHQATLSMANNMLCKPRHWHCICLLHGVSRYVIIIFAEDTKHWMHNTEGVGNRLIYWVIVSRFINPLVLGRCGNNLKRIVFKPIIQNSS